MSRFLSEYYQNLTPYVPGEQPDRGVIIKLNTNESPFPPSKKAIEYATKASGRLELYPDPDYKLLRKAIADDIGVPPDCIVPTNGSDEILELAFSAFCRNGAVFADITYGFYRVFAEKYHIKYDEIPLDSDFKINVGDYIGINKTIFIANPNAPTGIFLPVGDIERIVKSNPDNVVVVDEAYIDFGGESCIGLIDKYDNLLVTRTFSKSRSMAGARLGFGVANTALIGDINRLRFASNPYNINSMTASAGIGSIEDKEYFDSNRKKIIKNREFLANELKNLGFTFTESSTNFVFAKHERVSGRELYLKLKEKGILVRHFEKPRINGYIRITVGRQEEIDALVNAIGSILEGDI